MEEEYEITIEDLYPHLSDEERVRAKMNLEEYLETVFQIHERISADPAESVKLENQLKHSLIQDLVNLVEYAKRVAKQPSLLELV